MLLHNPVIYGIFVLYSSLFTVCQLAFGKEPAVAFPT